MAYKARCSRDTCENFGQTRTVTDEDELRGWDFCFSCDEVLEHIEEYDEYHQTVEVFVCNKEGCISHGDPVYLNLMQLEQCADFCAVCGNPMIDYEKFSLPGLDDDPDELDMVEYLERNSLLTSATSCLAKARHWIQEQISERPKIIELKHPVAYVSAGLSATEDKIVVVKK